jgi:polyamine oxidase
MTLERHENLRANIERLWFAGEANSAEYFGFLHGAWFEGREVGLRVAEALNWNTSASMTYYETLHGTTPLSEYDEANGWPVSSFVIYGDD